MKEGKSKQISKIETSFRQKFVKKDEGCANNNGLLKYNYIYIYIYIFYNFGLV